MRKFKITNKGNGYALEFPNGYTTLYDKKERAEKALEGALGSVLEISYKNGKSKKALLKSIKEGLFAFRLDGVSSQYYENNAEITCHLCPVGLEDDELLTAAVSENNKRG